MHIVPNPLIKNNFASPERTSSINNKIEQSYMDQNQYHTSSVQYSFSAIKPKNASFKSKID